MIFHFVDAENIGMNGLKCIASTIEDKVFVFSKDKSVLSYCQQRLFIPISNYPSGPNQADFLIISTLSGIIASLKDIDPHLFLIHSNDSALNMAFKNICNINGTKEKRITTKPVLAKKSIDSTRTNNVVHITPSPKVSERILKILNQPKSVAQLKEELKALKISSSDVDNEISNLAKKNKIRRPSKSKKKWIAV